MQRPGWSRAGLRHAVTLLSALLVVLLSAPSPAQTEFPGVAPMGGGPPPSGGDAPAAPSDMPETHAASGGTDTTLPEGQEPSLPAQPLAVSETTLKQIGSDGDPESLGTGDEAKRQFYGLYYNETAKQYRYRVLFPLWAERVKPSLSKPTQKDRASVFAGLYYNRRSADHKDDVLFPIAWNLRSPQVGARTTVVGPFVNRRTKTEGDDWLLPLYATGTRAHGGYTIIPPLLTYRNRDEHGGLNIVGPAYCSWEGGQSCDTRTAQDIDLGLAPFYFFGQNDKRLYEVVTPLLHYYGYNIRLRSWTNVYGPYVRRHTDKREMLHVLPIYFSIWGKGERHTTVAPLFHYGYDAERKLLVTPLFLHRNAGHGKNTFITWGYARHRGETELDMYTPLYWQYRDRRIGLDRHFVFPIFYRNTSPRESTNTVFPLFSYSVRHGVSKSLWVTPLFNYRTDLLGWSTSLHPLAYFGKSGHDSHNVAVPFYFDFKGIHSRTTVIPPLLFARHRTKDTLTQVVANVYYTERKYKNGKTWEVHFLPLLSYGHTPHGHFWNILFGFAGYTRNGPNTTVRALWIPIPLSQTF